MNLSNLIILLFITISIATIFSCSNNADDNNQKSIKKISPKNILKSGERFKSKEVEIANKRGIEMISKKKFKQSLISFKKANQLEPNHPAILSNIALAYMRLKEYDQAEVFFKQSIQASDSTYLAAITNLANLYVALDEPASAIELCRFALEKSNSAEIELSAYTNWIFALFKQHNFKEASELFKKLESLHGADQGESAVFKAIRLNLKMNRPLIYR